MAKSLQIGQLLRLNPGGQIVVGNDGEGTVLGAIMDIDQVNRVVMITSPRGTYGVPMREVLAAVNSEATIPHPTLEAQFARLLALLALTDEERGFIRAALAKDAGKDLWCILADFLEERGKDEAAGKFRKMGGQG